MPRAGKLWRSIWPVGRRVLQAAVLLAVAWYAVTRLQWSELRAARLDWRWVLAGASLQLVYLLAYAVLWHIITVLHRLAIPFPRAVGVVLFSLIGKYVPMKVGMVLLRALSYQRMGGHSGARVALCCYLEWALSVYAAVLVGIGCSFVSDVAIPLPHFRWWGAGLLVLLAPFTFPPVLERLLGWVLRRFKKQPLEVRISWLEMLGLLLGYALAWLLLGTSLYCLARGVTPAAAGLWVGACAAYALAGLVGIVAVFAPAGLGVRDGALMLLLGAPLGSALAVTVSVLARAVSVVVELAAVGAAWLSDRSLRQSLGWARREAAQGEALD